MQFPFETTTKDGRKATVLGAMPDGRLVGFIELRGDFAPWAWEANGSGINGQSITLPLQIKPLTTYRTRDGKIAWTSGLIRDGWVHGMTEEKVTTTWRAEDGRWCWSDSHPNDLVKELPPGTTD